MKCHSIAILILPAVLLAGCRTAELMSCRIDLPPGMTSCGAITISQAMYAGDVGQEQGKTIEAGATASAKLAATLRDITASQSGPATGANQTGGSETTVDGDDAGSDDAGNDEADAPTPK